MQPHQSVASVVGQYLDGEASLEDAAIQVAQQYHRDALSTLEDGRLAVSHRDRRLYDLMDEVQLQTSLPCIVILSITVCPRPQ